MQKIKPDQPSLFNFLKPLTYLTLRTSVWPNLDMRISTASIERLLRSKCFECLRWEKYYLGNFNVSRTRNKSLRVLCLRLPTIRTMKIYFNKRRKNEIEGNNEKIYIQQNIFPLNRFNGLRSSQRSPASVGVKFIKIIFTMKNHSG